MSRIVALPIEEWDPELRAYHKDRPTPLQLKQTGIMAQAPHMARANTAFMKIAMQGRKLSRRLLELVRLRIAFHNQCRSCMALRYQSAIDEGLTEDAVCSLEKPMDASNLSDREKAAVEYADLFAINHFAITDEAFESLRKHFTESEIVELAMFIAYFVGMGRFMASLNVIEELPEDYRDKSRKMAPWESSESVLVDA